MGNTKGDGTGNGWWPAYGDSINGNARGNGVGRHNVDGEAPPYERDVSQFYQNRDKVLYGDGAVN